MHNSALCNAVFHATHLARLSFCPTAQRRLETLSGCYHVYLDVGSNVGVQIRKLYEPHLFDSPKPLVTPLYNALFGDPENRNLEEICTVGFEPNPSHKKKLLEMQTAYRACGWPVKYFVETAVSDSEGTATFYTDEAYWFHEWGGSIVKSNSNLKKAKAEVKMIRLANFIKEVVAKRDLGRPRDEDHPPSVLMKMDIEGAEVEVMTDLVVTGTLQFINVTMMEWHPKFTASGRRQLMKDLAQGILALSNISKTFDVIDVEDETYVNFDGVLPNCNLEESDR